MGPDHPAERRPPERPGRKPGRRIETLMVAVAVVAVALGWHLQVARVERSLKLDRDRFMLWLNQFEVAHPDYRPTDLDRSSFMMLPPNRLPTGRGGRGTWSRTYRAPSGRWVWVDLVLRKSLLGTERRVTFASPGGEVTWPFEDIERDRKADPAEVFPAEAR